MTATTGRSIIQPLRDAIASREVSVAEVIQACLDRIDRHRDLNAVVSLAPERALLDAKRLDRAVAHGDRLAPRGIGEPG